MNGNLQSAFITMRQPTNNLEKLQTNENGCILNQWHANSVAIPCENFLVELGQQEFSAGKCDVLSESRMQMPKCDAHDLSAVKLRTRFEESSLPLQTE
jgi:hypothetical protein